MAAIAVAALFGTYTGIAQARGLNPLPPIIIGYETGTAQPGPSEYPAVSPTPIPSPDVLPPQPIQPLD